MKILVVCQYYAPEPFRISDLCEGLVQLGHQVTVVTGTPNYPEGNVYPGYENGQHREETVNGVHIHRCPLHPRKKGALHRFLNYYSFVFHAGRYLKSLKEDFDVVFVNQLSPVMMAVPALKFAKKHGKKCVIYCLDLWPESLLAGGIQPNSPVYRYFLKVSKKIYRQADALAVSSHGFLEYFEKTLQMDSGNILYLPQYAEDLFGELPQKQKHSGGTDFLFAGNIGTTQSAETIVKAARILKDHPEIRFHMVGGGISLDHCKELAEGLTNITFYGRRPLEEMPEFYAMADVMLITLIKDPTMAVNFPGKIQSYMASGKPIVGAIDGETARMIREADCGFCAPAENPEALAEAVLQAAQNPEARACWGRNARSYYAAHFRKETFLQNLEGLLKENC